MVITCMHWRSATLESYSQQISKKRYKQRSVVFVDSKASVWADFFFFLIHSSRSVYIS